MQTFNVFNGGDWDDQHDRDGYRHRATAIGKRLGASLLGGSLYELPPGEKTWPYHYEQGCEEWLLVVSGKPTLRSPDGEQTLEPGAVNSIRSLVANAVEGLRLDDVAVVDNHGNVLSDELRDQGLSYAQVGQSLGVTRGRIAQLRGPDASIEAAFFGGRSISIATPLRSARSRRC